MFRRAFVVLLSLVVTAALAGAAGVRTSTARATAGGHTIEAGHPAITRPGLPATVDILVRRRADSPARLRLAVSADYLGLFEDASPEPAPDGESVSGDLLVWTWDDAANEFRVSIGSRVGSSVQWRKRGEISVLDDRGGTVVRAAVRTWVAP